MIEKFYAEKIIGVCSCGAVNTVKSVRYAIGGVTSEHGYKLVDVWRCSACRRFNHSFYYSNFEKTLKNLLQGLDKR